MNYIKKLIFLEELPLSVEVLWLRGREEACTTRKRARPKSTIALNPENYNILPLKYNNKRTTTVKELQLYYSKESEIKSHDW